MKASFQFLASLFIVFALTSTVSAQEDKSARPSPPASAEGKINDAKIAIHYSSPAVKERTIWGELVPYGKVWRTGANEATIFETTQDVKIEDQTLPAGKYGLFTIPGESEWVVIFNSVWDQWGAYRYNPDKDVLRVTVKPVKSVQFRERLEFDVRELGVVMSWENLEVAFRVD